MNDILHCPICNSKLKNSKMNNNFLPHYISKSGKFIQRTCSEGMNHTLIFFTDVESKKIVYLKTSLNHKYSKFIDVNFFNSTSKIYCFKMGQLQEINIPKALEIDFPSMEKLKEKVNALVTFS